MSFLAGFLFDSVSTSPHTSNFTENAPASPDTDRPDPESTERIGTPRNLDLEASLRNMIISTSTSNTEVASNDDDSSFGGQTILSSAPSDTPLEAPVFRAGMTDNHPWPTPGPSYPLSVSTASSRYIEMEENNNLQDRASLPRQDSFASLSFHASSIDSAVDLDAAHDNLMSTDLVSQPPAAIATSQTRASASFPSLEGHNSALPWQSTAIVLPHHRGGNLGRQLRWYANFNEKDWESLRQRAQMAMKALDVVPRRNHLRPVCLPPCPPDIPEDALAHPAVSLQMLGVPSSLPDCFVCAVCQSAIVGALTLDCDCGTTVCSACWEYRSVSQGDTREDLYDLARGLDYEIVSSHQQYSSESNKCPCCWQSVHNSVPCHALDVAILRYVEGLGSEFLQFQHLYFERLRYWREEVVRRQQEASQDEGCVSDAILAKMMQEEEKVWCRAKTARTTVWVPGAFGFFVAMVASISIGILTQRRGEGRFRQIRDS